MNRSSFLISVVLAAALLLPGCGRKTPEAKSVYQPDNDIITYDKIDPRKTALLVSTMGDEAVTRFSRAFEEQNPDTQIVCIDITGGNDRVSPVADWVKNGRAPDVMFHSVGMFEPEEVKEYFVNLSDSRLTELFDSEALNSHAIDANVYCLPGPFGMCCINYNKTLFEKYSWPVPQTFDEFFELCLRIKEDTNGTVEAWNPNAKYSNEILTALEGFTYAELFGGLENRGWLNDFLAEKAAFKGHMEPFYELIKRLADAGIIREEHLSYSATTCGKEFAQGKIAMINHSISNYDNDEFDFGYMPFPTTEGRVGYIALTDSKSLFVPKKEHTEKEQDAIERYMKFFASVEGQRVFMGDLLMASSLKGVSAGESSDLAALQPALDMGHRFTRINFNGKTRANFSVSDATLALIKGEKTVEQCVADVDDKPFVAPEAKQEEPPALAVAEKEFSMLETSFYLADMYREKTGADIALINHCAAYRGNLMRIFKGGLNINNVRTLKPRSFGNDAKLETLKMTGEQLLSAMNAPMGKDAVTNSVYAYSGLKCEIAPSAELGKKYVSVKLADGKNIEKDKLYTVAAWQGTVSEEFVTETLSACEGTFEELLSEKLQRDKKISPADDGRCRIVW